MTCKDCVHGYVCIHAKELGYDKSEKPIEIKCDDFENKSDFVNVTRCNDCKYAIELDKHCNINRSTYKHCSLWRGEEERNVWHKYKKYYKDYSIVNSDDYCSRGERRRRNDG